MEVFLKAMDDMDDLLLAAVLRLRGLARWRLGGTDRAHRRGPAANKAGRTRVTHLGTLKLDTL